MRYRPPQKPGSNYITPEGKKRLEGELDYLWRVKRPRVTQAVSEAAAMGDRSENAEYIYGKKQLREIDRRVRFLQKRLDHLIAVDQVPEERDRIFFGAWVELEDEQGQTVRYRIVGPDEFDLKKGWISMDAPLAQSLMRKKEGEEVTVELPRGVTDFYINKVQYEAFEE